MKRSNLRHLFNYSFCFPYSPVPPPVRGVFAGDMKNLMLSDSSTSTLKARSFNAAEKIEMKGTSFYGVIEGKVKVKIDRSSLIIIYRITNEL